MITAFSVVKAFKKNCPAVRMTEDEEQELERLIRVALAEIRQKIIQAVES